MTRSLTRLSQVFLAALLLFYFSSGLQAQRIIYVTETGAGAQDGSSWEDATSDLYAVADDFGTREIWVAQGTYKPTSCTSCSENDRALSFQLRPNTKIIGGFTGVETSRSQASASNTTVLSGDIDNNDVLDANNSYNVVLCNDCGDNASLENLTITSGYADGGASKLESAVSGSAFYIRGNNGAVGSPNVSRCIFDNNFSKESGGAVYVNGAGKFGQLGTSNAKFRDCLFSNNESTANGGALFVTGGGFEETRVPNNTSILLDRCVFKDNAVRYVSGAAGNSGGAVFATAGNGSLEFVSNRTLYDGNDCLNDPGEGSSNGGAIYMQVDGGKIGSLNADFTNSIFLNNSAYAGGAYYGNRSDATFTNVTVTRNRSTGSGGSGGGIYTNGGTSTIVNCIIYNNSIINIGTSQTLKNVNATVDISYTLVEAANCEDLNSRPGGDMSTVNCDEPNNGIIYAADPQFDLSRGLPELLPSSPAVDAGDNGRAALPGDYNNNERILDIVDLGALESGAEPLPVELLAFRANPTEDRIHLDWLTAAEIDLEGYRLERSADGTIFDRLSFTNAAALGGYAYTDFTALPQTTYYYRLVSVDFDGTTYTSDLVTAQLGVDTGAGLVRRMYPNPSAGDLIVHLSESNRGPDVRASLYDGLGREVQRWSEPGSIGSMRLDLNGFANGLYTLAVTRGGHTESQRVLLRH